MAAPGELDDLAFIELCETVFDKNPMVQMKPGNVARLYRIAGQFFTADQFDAMIERVSLPNLREVTQFARASLAGVPVMHYDAVMQERRMILAAIESAMQVDGYALKDLVDLISRGDHRSLENRKD
jgi:hypothetical protein